MRTVCSCFLVHTMSRQTPIPARRPAVKLAAGGDQTRKAAADSDCDSDKITAERKMTKERESLRGRGHAGVAAGVRRARTPLHRHITAR
jgi:hypothetical protein